MTVERQALRDWHRLFGLLLTDFFSDSPFVVERPERRVPRAVVPPRNHPTRAPSVVQRHSSAAGRRAGVPVDTVFPFVHPERSCMHLGFHIYDVGFQSPDSESAKPMVFTTTLLLITLIATLNLTAMWLRGRLRKRYMANQF
jgi:hypothetical protein